MKKLFLLFLFAATAFAGKHTVLQVEQFQDGFLPDPVSVNPPDQAPRVKITEFNDAPAGQTPRANWGTVSAHASQVAGRIAGTFAPAKDIVSEIIVQEATNYRYKSMYVGVDIAELDRQLINGGYPKSQIPTPVAGRWDVECHAYGADDMQAGMGDYANVFGHLDLRAERDNTTIFVACPESYIPDRLPYWRYAKNVIRVGSSTGNVHIDESDPNTWPDIVAPNEEYPSYGVAAAASAGLCVIDVFTEAKASYKWSDIREILKATATPMGDPKIYGAGMINLPKAIEEAKRRVAGNAPPPVVTPPPPVITPPPVVQPPPAPTPPPVEKVEVKRTSWQKARDLVLKSGWSLAPTKNGGADLIDPQNVRRFYITADSYRLLMFNTPALRKGNPLPQPPK